MLQHQTDHTEETEYHGTAPAIESGPESQSSSLSPEEIDDLFRHLQRSRVRRRIIAGINIGLKWTVIGNVGAALGMFLYNLVVTAGRARLAINLHDWSGLVKGRTLPGGEVVITLGGAWILLWTVIAAGWLSVRSYTRRQRRLSRELPHVHDPRALSPLLDALTLGDDDLRTEIAAAVEPLLRSLTPRDTMRVSNHDREVLHGEIRNANGALREVSLYALEQVGTRFDVECLDAVLQEERTPAQRVRLQRCIYAIKERSGIEKARETLLRPSEGSPGDEHLLRAAASTQNTDPATLLRPR